MAPQVRLASFTLADAPFVLGLLNSEGFLTHIGDKGVRTVADAEAYLRSGPLASYAAHGHGLMRVDHADSGEPIGMAGLLKRDTLDLPDLGYALLPEWEGQGLARAAAGRVLVDAHARLGIREVLAVVKPGNTRSIRLLEALGFKEDGWVALYPGEPDNHRFRVRLPVGSPGQGGREVGP